jgi:nitrate/TMAO reductase-like tetraheme cytochrome c subunit
MSNEAHKSPKRLVQFRNWISLSGAVIATGSLFAFLLLFANDLIAEHSNPYVGILAYVVAPGFLVLGLALIAVGVWRHHRRLRKMTPGTLPQALIIDLSRPRDQKVAAVFVACSVFFLLLTAIGSQRTYHYTESVQFCGQACHQPMKPEFTAYLNSPHARIACTECHVGPGATWYVKSKINGVRQLYCTLTDKFDRPIKTPIRNLRPAQDTCEQCHWPQRFVGDLDRTYSHFLADETNTAFSVRLSLHVGGGDSNHGPVGGIHWHMNIANKVEYVATDDQRQTIPWVRFTDAQGVVTEFRTKDFKDDPAKHTVRKMDCMDCHNRPAHHFRTPNAAVDLAMSVGHIDPTLPWVKSNVVATLVQPYATEPEALEKIAGTLRARYPQAAKVDSLIGVVQDIYKKNFFPEMKADWRAYPNHIGHKDWAGCFRCHDGKHKSADGQRIIKASDCNSCHTILAQGNGLELERLSSKGHNFMHVDAEYSDFSCIECHTGAFQK